LSGYFTPSKISSIVKPKLRIKSIKNSSFDPSLASFKTGISRQKFESIRSRKISYFSAGLVAVLVVAFSISFCFFAMEELFSSLNFVHSQLSEIKVAE